MESVFCHHESDGFVKHETLMRHHLAAIMTIIGLMIEALGVFGMAFYPIRRRFPRRVSPIDLIGWGGVVFFAGIILNAVL